MDAAQLPAPQLGRILIAAGLLNEEQLAQALEEQARTGRRLGEIIVHRGFISGPALANALAEQHGGVLKTEYGFASGLGGVVARRAASEAGAPVSPLRPPDPTLIPQLRTAEPVAVAGEQEPAAPEAPTEPTPMREALQSFGPPEPAEPPEPASPSLRTAESPSHAPKQPSEPVPEPVPPLVMTPTPPDPVEQPPQSVPEPELESPPARDSEPTPLPEAAAPVPEPVELRPPSQPTQDALAAEPEFAITEPEPTPLAEAAEPLPEPVELRPQLPESEPTPAAEVAAPVPEPAELRPPAPVQEAPQPPEPESEPTPEPVAAAPDDRDALIDSLHARIEAQEHELAKLREELEHVRAQRDVQVHAWPEEPPAPTPAPAQTEHYLLCVPTTAGYVLLDRVGPLPRVGQAVEVPEDEGQFTVTKVVRLPRNGRPCAYLQRA